MNKQITAPHILLLLLTLTLFTACKTSGSGIEKIDQRQVGEFSSMSFEGAGKVEVTVAESFAVTVRTDDNLVGLVKSTVESGELKVLFPTDVSTDIGVNVSISAPTLTVLSLRGATELTATGLTGKSFDIKAAGASNVTLSGALENARIECRGAAKVNASALKAQNLAVILEGAAKADVHAEKTLDVKIQGVGKVTYSGSPKLTEKIDGVGKIVKR